MNPSNTDGRCRRWLRALLVRRDVSAAPAGTGNDGTITGRVDAIRPAPSCQARPSRSSTSRPARSRGGRRQRERPLRAGAAAAGHLRGHVQPCPAFSRRRQGHRAARQRSPRGQRQAGGRRVAETVEVSAASQFVQPTPAVQSLMGPTQVQELPLNNRNFVAAGDARAGRLERPLRRSRHRPDQHGQHLGQRRPPQRRQLARRRRVERGRRLEHHAALDADAGIDPGVQDHHEQLRGRVAAQRRRRRQHRHQGRDAEVHRHAPTSSTATTS